MDDLLHDLIGVVRRHRHTERTLMPNPSPWTLLIAQFAATWPRVQMGASTVRAYIAGLNDLPIAEVEEALTFATRTMTFPPTVAELRAIVAKRRLGLPEAGAAYEAVNAAVMNNSTRDLPQPARRALDALGGSWAWRTTENPSVMRGQFLKLYDEFVREAEATITVGAIEASEQVSAIRKVILGG